MLEKHSIYAAMLTPLTTSGKIDKLALYKMVDFYKKSGITGLFALSSVGESAHFNESEATEILQIVQEANSGELQLFAGITSTCSANAISLGKIAQDLHYDGIVSAPPYFIHLKMMQSIHTSRTLVKI